MRPFAEVLRQVGKRLVHKQWLIFYPLALAVINTLAFLAVYGASGGDLRWGKFFAANYQRWQFMNDEFFSGFSFTPALGIAVFVGLTVCLFTAMLKAPLFRAIAGPGYPLAPRNWEEAGRLSLFYVFFYLVVLILPQAVPLGTAVEQVIQVAALVVALLLVYADYVIVFEGLSVIPALRRSVRLLSRRWPPVLLIFVILQLVVLDPQPPLRPVLRERRRSLFARAFERDPGVVVHQPSPRPTLHLPLRAGEEQLFLARLAGACPSLAAEAAACRPWARSTPSAG